ncbi:MAG TPA: TOBE domain-containing protein, partial [Candidatus Binatia bacterium]
SHAPLSGRVVIGIRPEDIRLGAARAHEINEFAGEVRSAAFLGGELVYEVDVGGKLLLARTMSDSDALRGRVFVRLPAARMTLFPRAPLSGEARS